MDIFNQHVFKTLFAVIITLSAQCGDGNSSDGPFSYNGSINKEYYGTAIVDASPSLNIRTSPDGEWLCRVMDGEPVKVLYTNGDEQDLWAYVQSANCSGWASALYLIEDTPRTDLSFTFPFNGPADADYTTGIRAFGSCRDDCERRHAAADLYGTNRRIVYSIGSGTIIDFSSFYLGTWALVVDHGQFIVRYGELDDQLVSGLSNGSRISRGQPIGYIGKMAGLSQSMLHFERYTGESRGPLTVRSNPPFQRRDDLVNPTSDLLLWKYPRF